MAIGLLEERLLTLAAAPGPGNLVVLYGSATGRDGIGGASVLASATFTDDDPSKRPSVQVGDPFAEKLLIEASLELIERGLVEGLQDLGAGGITCATSETADRAGTGILVDLDAIPRREPGLEPFEVMISESQERMCAAVLPERWAGRPRGLRALGPAGRDHRPGHRRRRHRDRRGRPGRRRAAAPGRPRDRPHPGGGPDQRRDRPRAGRGGPDPPPRRPGPGRPGDGQRPPAGARDGPGRRPARPARLGRTWRRATPSSTSTTRRSAPTPSPDPGRGAAVLRVKGTTKALVATTDGNQSVGALDPWLGAALSVAEATRNVSITGARPLGVTNCLNYGDPTRPEAFWQLTEGVRGLADACRALGLPVTGGNVSLYNESPAGAIAPTPEIGVVGLLDDIATLVGPAFVQTHDAILLVGETVPGLAGSAYAALAGGATEDDPPALDLAREAARPGVHPRGDRARPRRLGAGRLGRRAGGRARRGRDVGRARRQRPRSPSAHSPAVDLFGEGPSRLVVTCRPRYGAALELLARQHGLPVETIGSVGGDRLVIELGAPGIARAPSRTAAAAWPTRSRCPSATSATPGSTGSARALGWEALT